MILDITNKLIIGSVVGNGTILYDSCDGHKKYLIQNDDGTIEFKKLDKLIDLRNDEDSFLEMDKYLKEGSSIQITLNYVRNNNPILIFCEFCYNIHQPSRSYMSVINKNGDRVSLYLENIYEIKLL